MSNQPLHRPGSAMARHPAAQWRPDAERLRRRIDRETETAGPEVDEPEHEQEEAAPEIGYLLLYRGRVTSGD